MRFSEPWGSGIGLREALRVNLHRPYVAPYGACPNMIGPVPTAYAVGYTISPAPRADKGTQGDPCHGWLRPPRCALCVPQTLA